MFFTSVHKAKINAGKNCARVFVVVRAQ